MSGHRALPLVEVEARARDARKPWPNGVPPCTAKAMADDWEAIVQPQRFMPEPPAYPWRALGIGLLVMLVTCGAVHLLGRLGTS